MKVRNLVALGAVLAASSSLAFATPLTPGATVTATNAITVTNNGILAQFTGTITPPTFVGNYTEYVIRDGSNPFGVNDLTFVLTASNSASSPNTVEHVTNGDGGTGFNSLPSGVNVGYISSINGLTANGSDADAPLTVDESASGVVSFNFTGGDAIAQGTGTQFLVIQTSATNYTPGFVSLIDSTSGFNSGFVPAAATPEPSSLMLLGTGLFGAAGTLLKRRKSASSIL